jgi:recombination protein RecA
VKAKLPKEKSKAQQAVDAVNALHAREKKPPPKVALYGGNVDTSVEFFSTGTQEMDDLLSGLPQNDTSNIPGSGKGWPRGRIIGVRGGEQSGKTTLVLQWIAEVQHQGGVAAFIDMEHALDLRYAAKHLGVNLKELLLEQPLTAERGLDVAIDCAITGKYDLIALDSVASLVPEAEVEGAMAEMQVGLQARLVGKFCRKINPILGKTKTTLVAINQPRLKIGVMYGDPRAYPGGEALKFYSSIILDIRKDKSIKKGEDTIGRIVDIYCGKNKVAPPFREAQFTLKYGSGLIPLVKQEKEAK